MTVTKLTEGLSLIEIGMTVLESIYLDDESVATTKKSLENSFSFYKEVETSLQLALTFEEISTLLAQIEAYLRDPFVP